MTVSPTDQWLTDVRDEATQRLTRIARLRTISPRCTPKRTPPTDGCGSASNAAGRPTALTLEPAATTMPAADLAAAILRAVDEAAGQAGDRLAALVGALVPLRARRHADRATDRGRPHRRPAGAFARLHAG